MSDADHDQFLALCVPPSEAELTYADIPTAPAGFDSWFHWASRRRPSLPRFDSGLATAPHSTGSASSADAVGSCRRDN